MQKFILLGIALLFIGFVFSYSFRTETEAHPSEVAQKQESTQFNTPTPESNAAPVDEVEESVFVPYWNMTNLSEINDYDTAIYFGVSVTEDGINRTDQGFTNISTFTSNTSHNKKLLTIRMLDTDTNLQILEDAKAQETVISDIVSITKEYGFDGIVLDLELSVIPFTDVTESITLFTKQLSTELSSADLIFQVALYGDTYYRSRPYDVKTIGEEADAILIMAYDFHKSRGEPGPNFPLSGQKTYGYDFKQMIGDFTKDIPEEKISVIFGKFGYDWKLGKEGMPLTAATAFSLADAQGGFVPTCHYESCTVTRDEESQEMKVTFTDEEGYNHTAWFEDDDSIETKTAYLKEQGIGNVSYWVWGYW